MRFETGPGIQTQGDWTDCGIWPLGEGAAELFAFVAILGCSRMAALRFATDKTRPTTLRAIVRCVDDLGGASAEFLTDRDTALMAGRRPALLDRYLGSGRLRAGRDVIVVRRGRRVAQPPGCGGSAERCGSGPLRRRRNLLGARYLRTPGPPVGGQPEPDFGPRVRLWGGPV